MSRFISIDEMLHKGKWATVPVANLSPKAPEAEPVKVYEDRAHEEVHAEVIPIVETPVDVKPIDEAPVGVKPIDEAPVDVKPIDEAPAAVEATVVEEVAEAKKPTKKPAKKASK